MVSRLPAGVRGWGMRTEPSTIISVLTALVAAGIGVAVAFGADLTDAQQTAILATVAPLAGVIALLGPVIRQFVVSPASAAEATIRAKQDTSGTNTVPQIDVVGGAYNAAVKDAGFRPVPPPVENP